VIAKSAGIWDNPDDTKYSSVLGQLFHFLMK
jgi:hypothetical protein